MAHDEQGWRFPSGLAWEAGVGGSTWLVSPQPQQNITYLGTHRLEARQGTDCHSLVIHAAALGAGHHVHETVHLWCRATLCVEQGQVGMNTYTDSREHSPPFLPTHILQEACSPPHCYPLFRDPQVSQIPGCLFTLSDSCPHALQLVTHPVPLYPNHTP